MAHLIQVGAGSGGMPVLDMVCHDPLVTRVTLIEPDTYQPHNVVRHLFPPSAVGRLKAELAREWLLERRPELRIDVIPGDLRDPALAARTEEAASSADLGICAADNEPTKYHWDALMRRAGKPWTLGEVLAGGLPGVLHLVLERRHLLGGNKRIVRAVQHQHLALDVLGVGRSRRTEAAVEAHNADEVGAAAGQLESGEPAEAVPHGHERARACDRGRETAQGGARPPA